jgi:hypothetical protein
MSEVSTINFSKVVGFDYYDGYESGIGISTENVAYWFSSLDDSRSQIYRSFIFFEVGLEWWQRVCAIEGITWDISRTIFAQIENYSDEYFCIEREIKEKNVKDKFLAIADRGLTCVSVISFDPDIEKLVKEIELHSNGFYKVHGLFKERKKSARYLSLKR